MINQHQHQHQIIQNQVCWMTKNDAHIEPGCLVKDDAMMLSTISNVEPRVPPIASVVEESLYKSSLQSSRSYYSAEQSLEDDQEDDEEDGDEDFAKQFEQLQMEEPAFLPVKRNDTSSFALGNARRRQVGRSDEEATRSTISLGMFLLQEMGYGFL